MKTSHILSLFGEANLALTAGAIFLGVGLAEALVTYVDGLPRWGAYAAIGGVVTAIGLILISRGTEEAEEKVEKVEDKVEKAFDVERQIGQHPWLALGAAVAAGLIVSRLLPDRVPRVASVKPEKRRGEESSDEDERREPDEESSDTLGLGEHFSDIAGLVQQSGMTLLAHTAGKELAGSVLGMLGMGQDQDEGSSKRDSRHHQGHTNGRSRVSQG